VSKIPHKTSAQSNHWTVTNFRMRVKSYKRVEKLGNENQTLREELQRVCKECENLNNVCCLQDELKRLYRTETVANIE